MGNHTLTPHQAKKIKAQFNYRARQLRAHSLGVNMLAQKKYKGYLAQCTALAQKLLAAGYKLGFRESRVFYVTPHQYRNGCGWWWNDERLAIGVNSFENLSWVTHVPYGKRRYV